MTDQRLPPIPAPWPCALLASRTAGRFVVSTEAIAARAAVLEDVSYAAVVADAHRGYVCARCLHVSTHVYQCGGCKQAHYCSEACLGRDAQAVHGKGECKVLVELARLGVEGDSQPIRLAVRIAVTNAARAQQPPPAKDSGSHFHTPSFVRSLDHHFDQAPLTVRQGILAVAQALAGLLRPAGVATSASELARFILAIQCNAHAIRNADGHVLGLGLFPLASMLNHSCRPTAHHTFRLRQGQPPAVVFRSLRALAAGQEICYGYTDLLHPAPTRRAKLAAAYYFDCGCGRCAAWGMEGGGGGDVAADRLIERVLASAACVATGDCPGVLLPVGSTAGGADDGDRRLRCSSCGGEEMASEAESRLAVGTALLEARLRALQEEEEEEKEEAVAEATDGDGLPDAVRALGDMLMGPENGDKEDEEVPLQLGLHPQHWLVTQALLAVCRRLAGLSAEESSGGRRFRWMCAAAEAWALQNLWLVGTTMTMTGAGGGEEVEVEGDMGGVGRFPELGLRLVAAARAFKALGNEEAALTLLGIDGATAEPGKAGGGQLPARARRSLAGPGTGGAFADRLAPLRALAASEGIDGLGKRGQDILSTASD